MADLSGKTILHYHILKQIGQGGMGVVYLAEDTKLERKVAIKFLPANISGKPDERKRFEIEAKAAAALNHSNIATIHAIENSDDDYFIVMEYIEGMELKEKLKSGRLNIDETINIARQIAQGLEAAHEKNIIHRDIKSSNIMITDKGQVKIMDFGLAKVRGGADLTREQSTIGTAAYMSPEQARGEKVDQRSDIWSFGIVLYEMLSRSLPFKGDYDQALIYSILNEEPADLHDLPRELNDLIKKCLAKNPDHRFQEMAEILSEIETLKSEVKSDTIGMKSGTEKKTNRKIVYYVLGILLFLLCIYFVKTFVIDSDTDRKIDSIAVLPFENYSGDPKQEYFVDGMTEALISNLAQINSLRVISRTSVMKYKEVRKPIQEIAQELDVDVILEGSVFQEGNQARISVQLIDAATEHHIWAEKYNRELKDILALHNEVSLAVTREVKIKLTEEEETRLSRTQQINPESHDAYLKGQYQIQQYVLGIGTADNLRSGINYYQQAIATEHNWAEAHAALAYAYHWLASSQRLYEYYPLSKSAAKRAIELDEKLDQAHGSLAFVLLYYDWDWEHAAREYRRANELNPNGFAWGIALFFMSAGYYEDAIIWYKRAESRNPLSAILKRQFGRACIRAGRYEEAQKLLTKALDLNPNSANTHLDLAELYFHTSHYEEAIDYAKKAAHLSDHPRYQAYLGYVYAIAGRKVDAQNILEYLEKTDYAVYIDYLDELYVALGKKDKALEIIKEAYKRRDGELLDLKSTIVPDSLNDNPEFQKIMNTVNFPAQRYEFD